MIDLIDLYLRNYKIEIDCMAGNMMTISFTNTQSRYEFHTTINRDQLERLGKNCQNIAETISKELKC